jgi:hypothetical protein
VHGRTASAACDANDPYVTLAVHCAPLAFRSSSRGREGRIGIHAAPLSGARCLTRADHGWRRCERAARAHPRRALRTGYGQNRHDLHGLAREDREVRMVGTLTLACEGTVTVSTFRSNRPTINEAPEPISMGIILNLTDRTVSGLGSTPVTIDSIEGVDIQFSGSNEKIDNSVSGSTNRVTGDTEITTMAVSKVLGTRSYRYSLKCKPTKRMF